MNFIDICIRRPAFTLVLSLLLVLVGVISYLHLPLRWLPAISFPTISIYASYPGASATLTEKQITTPIEAAIAGVDGVDSIRSQSRQGEAYIQLGFKLGSDINAAAGDLRASIDRVHYSLPRDSKVTVSKTNDDENATSVLQLAFFDQQASIRELSDYVKQFVAPRFENIEGVGSVTIYGDQSSILRIALDPQKMASLNIVAADISSSLEEQNLDLPSGLIKSKDRFYPVMTHSSLESVNDFNNLILRHHQGQTVRLKDVAFANVEARSEDSFYRVNGKPAVGIAIIPKSTANPLKVSEDVLGVYQELTKALPTGMDSRVVYNQAKYINASIHNVYEAILEAIVCVLLVILIFFASWRAALIPIVTIPVCLLATFAILYLMKFSVNTISLMAMALAVGLVVDDAIVMLENIIRHLEMGKTPWEAAQQGGREIIFSLIAMTITLAAVYIPIAFSSGLMGKLFAEFTYTLAGAVIISGFVALTLTPMMCSRLLRAKTAERTTKGLLDRSLEYLENRYQGLLERCLAKPKMVVSFLFVFGALIYGFVHFMPSQLVPAEDSGKIVVMIYSPRDSSSQYTSFYMKQLEALYQQVPEIQSYDSWSWRSGASQTLSLSPSKLRKRSTKEIVAWLSSHAEPIAGIRTIIVPEASSLTAMYGSSRGAVDLALVSTRDYRQLYDVMQQFMTSLHELPYFSRIDSRLKWDGEQFDIFIDREKAADMEVPVSTITNTISTMLAGHQVGYFNNGGRRYEVLLQLPKTAMADPHIIEQLYVRNAEGKMLPLSAMTTLQESTIPESLPHYNRLRADTLSARLQHGANMGEAIRGVEKLAKQVLPADVKYEFVGEAKSFLESNHQMALTFSLALLFIYLVLVAQFESFAEPLVILLAVPFAASGALLTLKLAGGSINIYSCIGLVTLIGLIAKHGILIIDFTKRKQLQGLSLYDSIIDGARLRLRPILMTTAAMVLGALPLAFASGPGAESRQQIGWVIVGGLIFGTFFSLIVVPVMYSYLAGFKLKLAQRRLALEGVHE